MLSITLALAFAVAAPSQEPEPPISNAPVTLQVSLATDQQEFHIGETIPLRLAFSTSSSSGCYEINMAQYDRSGRMNYEHFGVSPSGATVDPLEGRLFGIMGGLTGFKCLTAEPWTIQLNLNEWIRFTQAGEFRLTVTSDRVGLKDPSRRFGSRRVAVRSNEVVFKIVSPTPAWQKQVFTTSVSVLDRPAPKPEEREKDTNARLHALETLRFLGTPEAAAELAKRLRGEQEGNYDFYCSFGLLSSPVPEAARRAMERELANPDHPISDQFLYTLRSLIGGPGNFADQRWKQDERVALEALVAALPAKRGKALAVSLSTALSQASPDNSLSEPVMKSLARQMISVFDQLPQETQSTILSYRWQQVSGPEMIPVLRRLAESYKDFSEPREIHAYESLQLTGNALKRWYELDPSGARPAVIREIVRPRPRYNAAVLGLLPDKTLPEADAALARNLTSLDDFQGQTNIASLIARYATDAILPQVLSKLDPTLGKEACDIEHPLLAYVLRVNPSEARPRIEAAIAARGKENSNCRSLLFQSVSGIHYDPVLEEIGIRALDDPDTHVAMTAAAMLGEYGSPAAEAPLRAHFLAWSAEWSGREEDLRRLSEAPPPDGSDQLGFGSNLARALGAGKSWLLDESALRALSAKTKVTEIQDQLKGFADCWKHSPLTISFYNDIANSRLDLRIAQYELHSMDDFQTKLLQFPSGTKFEIQLTPPSASQADAPIVSEIQKLVSTHGMVITRVKPFDVN